MNLEYYKNKRILVTGGTGSWGHEVAKQLLRQKPKEIRIFSRGEYAQVEMEKEFSNPRLSFYIGDVRDGERVLEAMRNIDIVFHLAALKHVPVGERNIWEFVQTNVAGTRKIIEAAKTTGAEKVVFISSDKASDPVNLYGCTKLIAEKMVIAANASSEKTKFFALRAGNVTGTHGSVIPLFQEQIKKFNKVTVTDPTMTRFLELADNIVSFLLKVSVEAKGGEIFIPKMQSVDVGTITDVMIKNLGDNKTSIEHIGVRSGEKFHEVLISSDELGRVAEYKDHFVILPYEFLLEKMPHLNKHKKAVKKHSEPYSSETAQRIKKEELTNKLNKLGFLS